jgi:DNA-directed RNA polymerase subunit K/omega
MSKKAEKNAEAPLPDGPLSQLLLSIKEEKYRMISLATRWSLEIKQRDQSPLPPQALLDQAIREILAGRVTLEEIEKLPPPVKTEKKEEFSLAALGVKPEGENGTTAKTEAEPKSAEE